MSREQDIMADEHYLKRELYDLIRSDPAVFEFLQAGSLDGIWFWDLEHPEIEWNSPRFWEVFGYSPSEKQHLAREWQDIIQPDDLKVALDNFKKHCADPAHPYDQLVRYRHKNGSTVWVRCRGIAIRDTTGRPVRMLGAHNDVTELKRAEEELRRVERRKVDTLLEVLPDGILMVDMDGHIIAANGQAELMFGYPREELLVQPIEGLLPEWFRELQQSPHVGTAADSGHSPASMGLDLHGRRSDRSEFPVDIRLGRVESDDHAMIICCIRDITERKHFESQLVLIRKMESVGLLAGGIAHDFNNLLTVMNGNADMVLDQIREDDPAREILVEIRQAGDRAAELTRQLLAFSRKQVLQPIVVNLNTVITRVDQVLRRLLGDGIELTVAPAGDLANVTVDPGQMERVIMNLAINARDAMPDGGSLRVETTNVDIDLAYARRFPSVRPGQYVMISMSDTGTGMDDATRERIFEPFFTTKDSGKGMGFGLSTVYGIVNQSGGSILVESELGSGTTFKVFLPRVNEPARRIHSPRNPTASRGTETILLVEDEPALRKMITRFLAASGYKVVEAADGEEALLQVRSHDGPIHLILTDVAMPRMGGPELALRLSKAGASPKVLYMSGFTEDPLLGASFISKPFLNSELTRKVREVLDLGIDKAARSQPMSD